MDSKADSKTASKLEVQLENLETRVTNKTDVQSTTVNKNTIKDLVMNYVEKVLDSKHSHDNKEKAERNRRKISIHSFKESDGDSPKLKED